MSIRFLRYARPAVAAAILQRAGDASARIRAKVQPQLQLHSLSKDGISTPWTAPGAALSVLGPADAVALAADQILARTPTPDAPAVSPGLFASVEFVRPDLPWLFTPYAPGSDDTLMPWLCLVVVPATAATLAPGAHGTVLHLAAADGTLLPNLTRAQEWAHVQEGDAQAGYDREAVRSGAQQTPRRFRSRLICPTALLPRTDYVACLVPTFLGGRNAGLGKDIDLDVPLLLGPAWTAGQAVELPVYDHWRFTTGDDARFADLVAQLEPYDASASPGRRVDATAPDGAGGPKFANATVAVDAVMRPPQPPGTPALPAPPTALRTHLATRLADPSPLAPPLYGGRHARAALPLPAQTPAWVGALNLDPVRRIAAGLGVEVVRRHQEEMMAAIWEQAGEIERANQLLRLGQTARAAAGALFLRRVAPDLARARDGQDLGVLLWLAPMLSHLLSPQGLTVRTELERSCLPRLALSGAFRKLVRPNGPTMRRLRRQHDGISLGPDLLLRLADRGGNLPPRAAPDQAVILTTAELAALGRRARPRPPFFGGGLGGVLGGGVLMPLVVAPASLEPARALARRLALARTVACRPLGRAGGADRETLFASLIYSADPAHTLPQRTRARIRIDAASLAQVSPVEDTLDPIQLAPKLPWPMLRPLLAFGRDWIAPALEARGGPENYIAVMEPNPGFIEAYMAGLNDEIGREMLWRGFPTDQRGTVFDRFWSEARAEVTELHTWAGTLGSHGLPGALPRMVIAVRGALLQRFGQARVFLQKASTTTPPAPLPDLGDPQATLYPLTEGRFPGGVAYFGFDLSVAEAIGGGSAGPGWYLVFQEPPVDLRFGAPANATPGRHVAGSGNPDSGSFAEAAVRSQQRVFIHSTLLLGPR